MSNLFGNLSNEGLEETQDRLGGYAPHASGIYTGPIKMAYAGQAKSGARFIYLSLELDGREYRETIYITNKAGENWFLNKETKKKVPLPGFTTIDDICLVATGVPLSEQESAEKVVNVYDPDAKKELPKSVPVLTELLGKSVSVAVQLSTENKSVKNGAGEYEPTADTRDVNNIEKVFDTDSKMTVAEARDGKDKATFWDAWSERNTGKVRDKRTIKDGQGGAPGRPGARAAAGPPMGGATQAPKKSLFGNRAA